MSAQRNLDREHRFLTQAAHGTSPFVDHAEQRLAAGEELYTSSWAWIGIRKHLEELLEEASDLGAWGCLADQALDLDPTLSKLHRDQIRAILAIAARHGAEAHQALTIALKSLEHAQERSK